MSSIAKTTRLRQDESIVVYLLKLNYTLHATHDRCWLVHPTIPRSRDGHCQEIAFKTLKSLREKELIYRLSTKYHHGDDFSVYARHANTVAELYSQYRILANHNTPDYSNYTILALFDDRPILDIFDRGANVYSVTTALGDIMVDGTDIVTYISEAK